MNKPKIMEASC